MRLKIELQATADAAYDTNYHHKLRGRLGTPLQDTVHESDHGTSPQTPASFTMSNIFEWGEIREGEQYALFVSSPREDVLSAIASDLQSNPEFNVGGMQFQVTDIKPVQLDVGEPGTEGYLTTATGVLVRIYKDEYGTYGLTPDDNPDYRCWEEKHTLEPFSKKIKSNLDWKHDHYEREYLPGPSESDHSLFTEHDFVKTYWLDMEVTTGVVVPYLVSKWYLKYEVQDNDHRRHLNLALETGIGERNGMGLGFLNPVAEEKVHAHE